MKVVKPVARKILLFDLYHVGHHILYLTELCRYWLENELPGCVVVAVHEDAVSHDDRLRRVSDQSKGKIVLHPLRPRGRLHTDRRMRVVRNDLEHGRLLRQVIGDVTPDHCLCMFFDHVQISLAWDLRLPRKTLVSGIYFRPSFHYDSLAPSAPSPREVGKRLLKRSLLWFALRNPSFRFLFSLDPYAIAHLPRHGSNAVGVALPDCIPSFESPPETVAIRTRLSLDEHRRLAVLFGILGERKGIRQLLESGFLLPRDVQSKLALLLAGPVYGDTDWLQPLVQRLDQETALRVFVDDRFISEREAMSLLSASDFVLVPYQRHVGSSNVLVRAAHLQRPVLGQDYGLMGEEIRRRKLGLAVETRSPAAIAEALSTLVRGELGESFDPESAAAYGAANTAARFASTIFDHIYSESSFTK